MALVRHVKRILVVTALAAIAVPGPARAQTAPAPEDVATPEAIVLAAYESIQRRPGEPYRWERFRSLFLPSALLIPNTEQTDGEFRVLTVRQFIDWVDGGTQVGGPGDRGFVEEQVSHDLERYGDVAQLFSTYRKRFWEGEEVLGHGINSFQLVRHDGRWWIAGIAWDEESGAGPIPEEYLSRP